MSQGSPEMGGVEEFFETVFYYQMLFMIHGLNDAKLNAVFVGCVRAHTCLHFV